MRATRPGFFIGVCWHPAGQPGQTTAAAQFPVPGTDELNARNFIMWLSHALLVA
jgi:hypothetical protein